MISASPSTPHVSAKLEGRAAVVTGGGRGTGLAIARALAAGGVSVLVAARTTAEIENVAAELRTSGANAFAAQCDVSDAHSVQALAGRARELLRHVDILVNNAGMAMSATLARTTLEDWNRVFAVNATGAFLCTQAFLPEMLKHGWGRIVNVASIAGLTGDRYIAAYAASKHALVGLTRSVAAEAAGHGVTVNAVCPGYLATDMTELALTRIAATTGRSRDEALDVILTRNPQRRLIDPGEVASAVEYLCGDAAAGINGATLVIDGGELRR